MYVRSIRQRIDLALFAPLYLLAFYSQYIFEHRITECFTAQSITIYLVNRAFQRNYENFCRELMQLSRERQNFGV